MRTIPITIVALVALLALPGAAAGQSTLPPDNAAIDEYVEGVPGPTGKKPSGGATGGRQPSGGSAGGQGGTDSTPLPSGVVTALEALGSDGEAVADLAATTAPTEPTGSTRPSGNGAGDPDAGEPGDRADDAMETSGVREVVGQTLGAGAGGGMGVLLPLILALALVGAIAAVLRRRRHGGSLG